MHIVLPGDPVLSPARLFPHAGIYVPSPPPAWLVLADGVTPTIEADLTTEGGANQYWYNNATYGSFASLLSALAGTFARSSAGYYYNSSGVLTSAGSNVARFDYDPATLAAKGLLVEAGATNILPASNNFTNATYWTGGGMTYGGTTAGPDGVSNSLVLFLPNAGAGNHYVNNSTNGTGGSLPWSYSKIAKAGGYHWLYLSPTGAGASGVWFDLQNGVVGTVSAGHTGRIKNLGNGIYRCTATISAGVGPMFAQFSGTSGDGVGINFSADGVSGVYVGFAQLEQAAVATSYIATTTASAARAADTFNFPVTDTGSATAFIRWSDYAAGNSDIIVLKNGGSYLTEAQGLGVTPSFSLYSPDDTSAGSLGASGASLNKLGISLGAGSLYSRLNTNAAVTRSFGSRTAANTFLPFGFSSGYGAAHIEQVLWWQSLAASNSAIQSLTT